MSEYFTDREFGARPPFTETIEERVWLALQALIATRLDDGSFGLRFPKACDDTGRLPYGADDDRFEQFNEVSRPQRDELGICLMAARPPDISPMWRLARVSTTSASGNDLLPMKYSMVPSNIGGCSRWKALKRVVFPVPH